MKYTLFIPIAFIYVTFGLCAQEVIKIPYKNPSTIVWQGKEKAYFSEIWQNDVVTNVSIPTMEVFRPKNPNGTSIIIAPGGGLYALSITTEGTAAAKWLNKKGITAFVLRYRLVPTGEGGIKQLGKESSGKPEVFKQKVSSVMPLSIDDGLAAITYVRSNAKFFDIDPNKIGFMGFSAGGAVTMGVAYNYTNKDRPDFIVPVYPWTTAYPVQKAPKDAPPMLVVCASDDPLKLAPGSIALYSSWLNAEKSVGLHMYSKGGHGFGMKSQGLPSDDWIQRFYDWALAQDIVEPVIKM